MSGLNPDPLQTERPIAWLIRESGHQGQSPRVMSGRMFISEDAARAAALRLTNRFWLRQAFPVFNPTPEQLGLAPKKDA